MFKKIFAYLFISCACSSMVIDKTHANQELHITNDNIDKDFYNSQPANEGKYSNVSFNGVEINSNFVEQFKKFLPYGCEELSFEGCSLKDGVKFYNLFSSGGYYVKHLAITSCDLTVDDADFIISYLYCYLVNSIDFSNNDKLQEDKERFQEILNTSITSPCYGIKVIL